MHLPRRGGRCWCLCRNPEWLVYHELVLTTKEYLRDCCTIEPLWLCDVAPKLFKPVRITTDDEASTLPLQPCAAFAARVCGSRSGGGALVLHMGF